MFGNGIKLTSDLKIESPRQNPANEVRRGGGRKGLQLLCQTADIISFEDILFIFNFRKSMEKLRSFEYPFPEVSLEKHYECPCSKTYKSYPALYTHIKNKHQGKVFRFLKQAPGTIKKPSLPFKKRGRPVRNKSRTSLESDNNIPSDCLLPPSQADTEDFSSSQLAPSEKECLFKIADILNLLPAQEIKKAKLNEISVVTEMIVFMQAKSQKKDSLSIGGAVAQFLQELSREVSWEKFRQFYALIMVFLQSIADDISYVNVLEQLPADTLCDYINDFIQSGAERMTEAYQISELAVFESQNMVGVFSWFFQWLLFKNYTSYRIILN